VTGAEGVRVGDVLRLARREVRIDPDSDYRLVGVYSFGKGIFHRDPKAGAELGDYRFFRIEPGDLVLSNIQAWEGAIAFATSDDHGTIGTHRFLSYVPVDSRIDTNWARWFFLSEPGMERIRRAAPGTAVRNRTLAVKRFEDLVISLPPIDVQRRVAARLDNARTSSERIMQLASRSNDLSAAFSGACAAARHLTVTDKLDRGWRSVRLGELLTRSDERVSVQADSSYPNLGIYGFGRGVFEKPPIEGGSTSATSLFRVRAGQFIYSRLFAFEGSYATVPERFDGYYVSNEFPSFNADPDWLDARWLASYLRAPERWAELASSSIGLGVRRQRVPVEALLGYQLLLPPLAEQREMIHSIERVDAMRDIRANSDARVAAVVPSMLNREFAALA
jgi:type I restriction enzyme, S subunit